jgi:putative transposase
MKRTDTASFVAEFPLRTTAADERALGIRLDAGRNIYNAALGEALRRLDLMRESRAWRITRAMPKGRERRDAFRALNRRFGFSVIDLVKFTRDCRNACWIKDHLGSQECQAITHRAFSIVEQYSFGKQGRPRFRGKSFFNSLENQCNKQGLRFKDEAVTWSLRKGSDLHLPILRDPRDVNGYQGEALARRVKYSRILRRQLRGREHWYVQLVLEGLPPKRRLTGEGAVGLDIGPSDVAMYSDSDAALEVFCPTITQPWRELRKIERAMDRSRRATNPDAFNPDGTWKRGAKATARSRRYQRLALKRRDRERRLASERKRGHGELANRILGQGTEIHLEKLSYRSFQEAFGRSVKVRAPGAFVETLSRKVEAADGTLIEINTFKTALSQFDHTTGGFVKKPRGLDIHHFGDGSTASVQRDLYSAFLARHCGPETLVIRQVQKAWPTAEPLLRRAMSRESQSASGQGFVLPQALRHLRADRSSKLDGQLDEAGDAVAQARAPESPATGATKTTHVTYGDSTKTGVSVSPVRA